MKLFRFVDKATTLGHDITSMGNLFPLLQRKIVASASTASCLVKSPSVAMGQNYCCLNVFLSPNTGTF